LLIGDDWCQSNFKWMNTRASVSCEDHLPYKVTSHPLEVDLTPIIINQQYTKSVYSQNKNGIGSSPDSSVRALILQAITPCTEIESGLYETIFLIAMTGL